MKVKTKNFQRLKGENEFEFPVGITIVQGRSGSGKSTLFYAVEDCLSNPPGVADVITWDSKSCEVEIENGGYAKWIKTPSSCEYVDKDGKEYIKASKIDSRDIDDLGFYFDKKDKIVNIHNEWDKLFPFGASDTEMFKLFEDIFNISSSFQIIENIKKDEQDCKGSINNINKNLNEITMQNNQIDGILNRINPDVDSYIESVQKAYNYLSEISNDFSALEQTQKYTSIFIPNEYDYTAMSLAYEQYSQILNDYNIYSSKNTLANIQVPESKEFTLEENPYTKVYEEYKSLLNNIEQYDCALSSIELEENSVREKLNEIKVCPTCGQSLKGDCCKIQHG